MKKLFTLILLASIALSLAGCKSGQTIEVFEPSSITLSPNPYVITEELEARRKDVSLREVTFQWAFEDGKPDLPAYSSLIVQMYNVAALIDSVAAIHMAPRIHAESDQPERRLVAVTVGEPVLAKDAYYGVETLTWVPTMVWHRN